MALPYAITQRFSRQQFDKMAEAGVFGEGQRVELIDGEIIALSPQDWQQSDAVTNSTHVMVGAFGATHKVRVQCPLAVAGPYNQPEPDLALVRREEYGQEGHPATADLVIEVAFSSLEYDRTVKAAIYARAGIADYWIVNLVHGYLEMHRQPSPLPEALLGYGYAQRTVVNRSESVAPLCTPATLVLSDSLFPGASPSSK